MQIIENNFIKEKVYIEKLKSGLTVMCIPKKNTNKKYIIFGTNYGSMDSKFIIPGEKEITVVPDGVAHFLEHKLFEQESGRNSLDVLSSLGVNANAYTTNSHTAYLYECTNNFYEALDEFMNYIQSPYFTDENVEKEKGIINQEIGMYDDDPTWKVYLNSLEAMYVNNPVKLDPAGTVETVSKINKEILYKCYNNFYKLSNMALIVCGDFEYQKIFSEIEKRIIKSDTLALPQKVVEKEPDRINKKIVKEKMNVNIPIFTMGIKDKIENSQVKKHVAIDIILDIIVGNTSKLFNELYSSGLIFSEFSTLYEYSRDFAHIVIQNQAYEYEKVIAKIEEEIKDLKEKGISNTDFERSKKKNYGMYVREFEDVSDVGNNFFEGFIKNINPFDLINESINIDLEYVNDILRKTMDEEMFVYSIVKKK